MKAGDILTPQNLRAIRPGLGLPTKHYELVMGQPVKQDVKAGTALNWNLILG